MNPTNIKRALQIAAKFNATPEAAARAGGRGIFAAKTPDERGELLIYDSIGYDWWTGGGVMAKDVVEKLNALKGVKGLDVRFNSPGGDVFEGKAIYEAIKRFDCADKVACIDSLAASAASMIMCACDRVVMSPAATVMIHRAWSMAGGNCIDMRATADILDLEDGNIAGIYQAKTGKPLSDCLDLMTAETWMNAEQAVELGFADEIARKPDEEGEDEEADAAASKVISIAAATQARINAAARAKIAARSARLEQQTRASPGAAGGASPARK